MSKKRLIKGSWLEAFDEWTLPRSEAPATMIRWAGLFTLSSMVKRRVWFPREILGSYDIYPNLYVVFVAKPGVARKSTTAGYAEELLVAASKTMAGLEVTFAGDVTSYSKLLQAMADSPDSSIVIVSSEFSSLVQTTPEAMYEILTDIFDNRSKFDWSTWAHGDKQIVNPVVNLLGATTPDWISAQPPQYFLGGGFASRVLFIFENEKRQHKMYYDDVDYEEVKKQRAALVHDLRIIAGIKGSFSHDSRKTRDYIEGWYQKHSKKEADDSRLEGYAQRKHIHGHKVAMLISLAERNDLKITREHWDKSMELLDEIESKIPRALSSLGSNPLGRQMNDILDYLESRGKADLKKLAGRFYRDLTLEQLKSTMAFLVTTGKIKAKGSIANPTYHFVKD